MRRKINRRFRGIPDFLFDQWWHGSDLFRPSCRREMRGFHYYWYLGKYSFALGQQPRWRGPPLLPAKSRNASPLRMCDDLNERSLFLKGSNPSRQKSQDDPEGSSSTELHLAELDKKSATASVNTSECCESWQVPLYRDDNQTVALIGCSLRMRRQS